MRRRPPPAAPSPPSVRWITETGNALPQLGLDERRRLAGLPATRAVFERLMLRLPALLTIEARLPPGPPRLAGRALRLLFWRVGAAATPAETAAGLRRLAADLVILHDVDAGMARSGNVHWIADLAERAELGYAFAVDSLRLGAGREGRAAPDLWGLNGTGLVAAHPLQRLGMLRLDLSGRTFVESAGEPEGRRLGGTVALFAQLLLEAGPLTIVAMRQNAAEPASRREAMLVDLLDHVAVYDPLHPVLLALGGCDDLLEPPGRPGIAGRWRFRRGGGAGSRLAKRLQGWREVVAAPAHGGIARAGTTAVEDQAPSLLHRPCGRLLCRGLAVTLAEASAFPGTTAETASAALFIEAGPS